MSVSVLIPAFNEKLWLDQTIQNILDTATGRIQIIVVDYGGNAPDGKPYQPKDKHVKSIALENQGERVAMNAAAKAAKCSHLLRIDAHCDFSPKGWDVMMEEVTGPKDMTQAVLTATSKEWKRLKGHWYERCRLLPNYEAKWEKPNRKAKQVGKGCAVCKPLPGETTSVVLFVKNGIYYVKCVSCQTLYPQLPTVVPNMSSTGCGFMIRRDFYWEIGGADESLAQMGAIGEEFSVKTWCNGGKVQTRTDVMIGHIFDTGGYDTSGVHEAREALVKQFGHRYQEIRDKFPDLDWQETEKLLPTKQLHDTRTVMVTRTDTDTVRDSKGVAIMKKLGKFRYVWLATDHPDERSWTDKQIQEKYSPLAVKIGQDILIPDDEGNWVLQETTIPKDA